MKELSDGGDWTTVYNVAKGGLEAGLGLAAGAAALADGIYDIGTSGAF